MPAPRINRRKIKDVLRLKLDAKLSHQQIADALGLSKGVVTKYVGLAAAAGLDWTAVQSMDEAALERRLMVGLRSHRCDSRWAGSRGADARSRTADQAVSCQRALSRKYRALRAR